ncbi:acyl-CoA N-acyltransferase [Xylariales sp. PMI_506]|nr:acyl-CoA N-acyltransferase [Xylariales sp. PMI_506]
MPYAVLPSLLPDITPTYDVYFAAFKGEKILKYLFPGGVDRQAHRHGTTLWLHHDRNGYTIKCVDSDTGKVVGMATWEVFWRPGKVEGWHKPKGAEWLKGDHKKKAEIVLMPLWEKRDQFFGGRKHVYCVTMATHPDYRRKGIGRMLVQWGIDIAEQLGLPIYVESTTTAVPLFESTGFKILEGEAVVHKASATGDSEDIEVPLMVRMPTKANGLSFEDWVAKGYPDSY